jgi:hypothetical protein
MTDLLASQGAQALKRTVRFLDREMWTQIP